MLGTVIKKIVGTKNDREVKRYRKIVAKINQFEESFHKLSDDDLSGKTSEFRDRLAKGESLEAILPEAFAVVREGSSRVMGMRHFDVQMVGGIVLHRGEIGEMRTGEGKTLMCTLPAYLNALAGQGVHVVTVNDYLARRDCEWVGPIFEFLFLTNNNTFNNCVFHLWFSFCNICSNHVTNTCTFKHPFNSFISFN